MSAPQDMALPVRRAVHIDRTAFDKAMAALKVAAGVIADDYPSDENLVDMEARIVTFRTERDALRGNLRKLEKVIVDETIAAAIAHARDEAKARAVRVDEDFERMLRVIAAQRQESALRADRIEVQCPICGCEHSAEVLAAHVDSHLAGTPTCRCPA
jgi:predicted component of type VI protein secretion system